jgi:protein-S-isoprenylcysteine O-methyltransferase Ste14
MYSGALGMLAGTAMVAGLGRWLIATMLGMAVLKIRIRDEERLLTLEFGAEYDAYRRRVPQLIPRIPNVPIR